MSYSCLAYFAQNFLREQSNVHADNKFIWFTETKSSPGRISPPALKPACGILFANSLSVSYRSRNNSDHWSAKETPFDSKDTESNLENIFRKPITPENLFKNRQNWGCIIKLPIPVEYFKWQNGLPYLMLNSASEETDFSFHSLIHGFPPEATPLQPPLDQIHAIHNFSTQRVSCLSVLWMISHIFVCGYEETNRKFWFRFVFKNIFPFRRPWLCVNEFGECATTMDRL